MVSLTPAQQALLGELSDALIAVPGVRAVALGGSYARGTARADSDLDVGLYYEEAAPFEVSAVDAVLGRFDPRPERVVTETGEWGPWVNGGAWLRVGEQPVDVLYRAFEQLDHWTDACERGERVWDYAQTPTHGFHSQILMAELSVCVPLADPDDALARRKARVAEMPTALRDRLLQDFLWHVAFTLYHARGHAGRGDVYNAVGCLNRAAACLVQAWHALAGRWFTGDKGALAVGPEAEARELEAVLAAPGADAASLSASVERVAALHGAACERAGDRYRPPFDLGAIRGA